MSTVAYISGDSSCAGFGSTTRTRALARAGELGRGSVARGLRRIEVARRAGMGLDQLTLPAQLAFPRLQVGFGFSHVGRGGADVGRCERDERGAPAHALADLRLDAH